MSESEREAKRNQLAAEEKAYEKKFGRQQFSFFMKYKDEMQSPKVFRFFEKKDCWKPRKNYDDIKDPRIVKILKDKRLQQMMQNPDIAAKWRSKEFWQLVHHVDDKVNTYVNNAMDFGQMDPK